MQVRSGHSERRLARFGGRGRASFVAVLANMLGASAARYALAMGLDQKLSTRAMIAATRQIMQRRIAPTLIDKKAASVNAALFSPLERAYCRP